MDWPAAGRRRCGHTFDTEYLPSDLELQFEAEPQDMAPPSSAAKGYGKTRRAKGKGRGGAASNG